MREQVTLYGDDARQFAAYRKAVGDRRDGNAPGNAELVRLMMEQFDVGQPIPAIGEDRQ